MTLAADFMHLIEKIELRTELPGVSALYLPPAIDDPDRVAAFGAILLEDNSCGFFSAWLGETIDELAEFDIQALLVTPPAEIAAWYAEQDPIRSAIGFAAINAISQHVFQASRYRFDTATNSMGQLDFQGGDRVGMVGFFPPLVERLANQGIDLTIIEMQAKFAAKDNNESYRINFDPSDLRYCNKVLCTASTLLNHTLEEILSHCSPGATVALIGPTAGCLPDPLFDRGVDIVGGTVAVNATILVHRLNDQEEWGDSVQKYCVHRGSYPGTGSLLSKL